MTLHCSSEKEIYIIVMLEYLLIHFVYRFHQIFVDRPIVQFRITVHQIKRTLFD